ncbi:TfuA-like protein [Mesorhizobium sp. M0437]|uniref:TfuA-like protein n=1 Tax=Mesorhizobium sp. M0437 TaxID=2956945 RepID=UPI00333C7974
MKVAIFSGPTMRTRQRDISSVFGFESRPPAKRGDIYRAVVGDGVSVIGLIDGYFGSVPSVLHKEILSAMAKGCMVFGAASMGALRASELHRFGMIGIGNIFHDFVSGRLVRDDEVTIEHGPEQVGFAPASEALVNIRYTLANAVTCSKISNRAADEITEIAANTRYSRRTLLGALHLYNQRSVHEIISEETIGWIVENKVDQKFRDGSALLNAIREFIAEDCNRAPTKLVVKQTRFFTDFRAAMNNSLVRDLVY